MSSFSFNPTAQAPQDGGASYKTPDEGFYKMLCDQVDWTMNRNQDGHYLDCRFVILEGEFQGSKIFYKYNLDNKSEVARNIAAGELSSLCLAIGLNGEFNEPEQIMNKPFQGYVQHREYNGKTYCDMVKARPIDADLSDEPAPAPKAEKPEPKPETPAAGGEWWKKA